MGKFLSFMIIVGMIYSCSVSDFYTDSLIKLKAEKGELSEYAGLGLWLIPPPNFEEASSFDGFKSNNGYSTISVVKSEQTFQSLKKLYAKEYLNQQNTDLIELRPVKFGDIDSSFFSVVYNNRKATYRYSLIFDTGEERMIVKAWCYEEEYKRLNKELRESILSSAQSEDKADHELYQMAKIVDSEHWIYTKDGAYPTKSNDGSTVEIFYSMPLKGSVGGEIVKEQILKLTGSEPISISIENLHNAKMVTGQATVNGKKAFAYVIGNKTDKSMVITFQGNNLANFEDFTKFVYKNYLSRVLK